MTYLQLSPATLETSGARDPDQAGSLTNSNHIRLDALRRNYLAEVFHLPPDTATILAELAFGGAHE